MTEEHYKQAYEKEYEKNKKLLRFIESLDSNTEDWESLCDCAGHENHEDDCMTMKIRKDWDNLFEEISSF